MSEKHIRDEIRSHVGRSETFLITSAVKPDGDSVASQLLLQRLIRNFKGTSARIDIVNQAPCPERYRFLPGTEKMHTADSAQLLDAYDVAFAVDCSSERIGKVRPLYDHADVRVTIDHHKVRTNGGADINLVLPSAASTTEIIFGFVEDEAWRTPLDADTASLVYTGMIFDTGGFLYQLTTPHTLRIAARLLETGFDFSRVAEQVLLLRTYAARTLLGRVLTTAQRNAAGTVLWAAVTQALLHETGATAEDIEGIAEQIIFTNGVEAAVLFVELADKDTFKLSLRSRGKVNVAALARSLDPQGGGHDRAAGCNLAGSLKALSEQVVAELERALDVWGEPVLRSRKAQG